MKLNVSSPKNVKLHFRIFKNVLLNLLSAEELNWRKMGWPEIGPSKQAASGISLLGAWMLWRKEFSQALAQYCICKAVL